jgi:hypothetical protein
MHITSYNYPDQEYDRTLKHAKRLEFKQECNGIVFWNVPPFYALPLMTASLIEHSDSF